MALTTVVADKNTYPARDTVRQQLNNTIAVMYYHLLNSVFASAALAIATVTSKVKTVTASVAYQSAGVILALAATDNFWTIAGANVATGLAQKYLLLVDAAGVASVQEGVPAATLAGVTFAALPASGKAIVGILNVVNTSGANFIPGTTLLGAAGIASTFTNGFDDSVFLASQVTP